MKVVVAAILGFALFEAVGLVGLMFAEEDRLPFIQDAMTGGLVLFVILALFGFFAVSD